MKKQKIFARSAGYYWVHWCFSIDTDAVWRIAYYNRLWWSLDSDERKYMDTDFLRIDEQRIPRYWITGAWKRPVFWLYILVVGVNIGLAAYIIYTLINI